MKQTFATILAFLLCLTQIAHTQARPAPLASQALSIANSASPLLFTENRGQVADDKGVQRPDILFTAHSGGARVYLTATGIQYQFTKMDFPAGYEQHEKLVRDHQKQEALRKEIKMTTHLFTLSLEGANPHPVVRKEGLNSYTENFYLAQCPQGITGVHTFSRLVYEEVYPGIDWIIYSNGQGMKYDFIVHPGADPSRIKLRARNVADARISDKGELVMQSYLGEVREKAPLSFCDGQRVATRFVQSEEGPRPTFGCDGNFDIRDQSLDFDNGVISFVVGAYNKTKDLRIDPSVVWATYYGGTDYDQGNSCAADTSGHIYMAGTTLSSNGIASAGYQNIFGGGYYDAFVVKFDSSGVRQWATFYGGNNTDNGYGCATDLAGNVFLSGATFSTSGIAYNGFQNSWSGGSYYDAFLVKLNSSGVRIWSTYYGTATSQEEGNSCATDAQGNVYMTGTSVDIAGPSTGLSYNGFQSANGGGGSDGFMVKFSPAGQRLWASYYGGSNDDGINSCTVDASGNLYIAGGTTSLNNIAGGGFQNTGSGSQGGDAFLAKFNSSGSRIWSTYYHAIPALAISGTSAVGCATDLGGNVYIAGITGDTAGIASGGFQNTWGGGAYNNRSDGFLVKFSGSGARLWATYYGGSGDDIITGCATNIRGELIVAGYTNSTNNIASAGFQNIYAGGVWDGFVGVIDSAGNRKWGSYFGGASHEELYGCATAKNFIFLTGETESSTGISYNGFQNSLDGPSDAFLVKIKDTILLSVTISPNNLATICAGSSASFPFTSTGSFNAGNTYTAQLSNANGSFATPVNIGVLTSMANSGNISVVIPANTPAGTHYRIRIVSSSPVVISNDNGADITINTIPAQPGAITGNIAACTGSGQLYTIAPVPTATSYNWTLPATWIGSSSTTSISAIAGTSGGIISVTATNACGTSPAATLAVTAGVNVFVYPTISIPAQPVFCSGVPNAITAAITNAGANPFYQWKKNGANVGANASTYTDATLVNGDVISVTLISNAPCAAPGAVSSNSVTVSLTPSVVSGININTTPPTVLCAGTPLTFVTNIAGGGASPQYQWFKNGVAITAATSPVYTDAALANGDTITVMLTSSAACAIPPQVLSNKVGLTVQPVLTPSVNIIANPSTSISSGQSVTFTASTTSGGLHPSFQWTKNGVAIPFAIDSFYTTTTLHEGDVIGVSMISNAPCAVPVVVNAATLTIHVSAAVVLVNKLQGTVTLYPNPNHGRFTIAVADGVAGKRVSVQIVDALGRCIYATEVRPASGEWSLPVWLNDAADGIYVLHLLGESLDAKVLFTLSK